MRFSSTSSRSWLNKFKRGKSTAVNDHKRTQEVTRHNTDVHQRSLVIERLLKELESNDPNLFHKMTDAAPHKLVEATARKDATAMILEHVNYKFRPRNVRDYWP